MMRRLPAFLAWLIGAGLWSAATCQAEGAVSPATEASLNLFSHVFEQGKEIQRRYTCQGENIAPALGWNSPPNGTKSFALILEDPDAPDPKAPKMTWVHWVLFNLPPTARGLPEAVKKDSLPPGTREGKNGWKKTGYGGPCPPVGRHRYFFNLYALDVALSELVEPDKEALEKAMQGHVLAQATLIGTYQKE
jgi:Raf kinase inhibitor-like YbhB/YbcL family protein